jgi:predicted O-methyltransferase YrrM
VKVYSILKFLKYFLSSSHKRGHGIHSPFVFNLVLKVFRNKISTDIVCTIETIRKKLVSDHRIIKMTDYGAGSEMKKMDFRKVSDIAKHSSVPAKYGKLLAGLSKEFGRNSILEFGTSFGISTMYLAAANPLATIYTMEGCPATSEIALENFKEAGLTNIKLRTDSFEKVLPEIENEKIRPGLVFIDGNHRKEPLLEYFSRIVNISDENTVIVIDDICYSREMGEAWKAIKKNEKVSFTIDLFRMGLIFFREGMNRFDYIIRY